MNEQKTQTAYNIEELEQIKQIFFALQSRINLKKLSHKESIKKYYELLE
ncbi:MAG: hypothetical protein ACE5J3_03420 [Methanosarcinales archaeon]